MSSPENSGPSVPQRFKAAFGALRVPSPLGIAVSGGGDSLALLHLIAAQMPARALRVASVDHGLRPESVAEATFVGRVCAGLGIPHDILRWQGWNGQGNLQAQARDARRGLLLNWANQHGLKALALGHTVDDQAETVLMNLMRGSGVDGLTGMRAEHDWAGLPVLRPLLGIQRAELRAYLQDMDQSWVDDPSNDNPNYQRVQTRRALTELGLAPEGIAQTAARLQDAREVLEHARANLAALVLSQDRAGAYALSPKPFLVAPRDTRRRVMAQLLMALSGDVYPPRLSELDRILNWIAKPDGAAITLMGAHLRLGTDRVRIYREYAATPAPQTFAPGVWDHRWYVDGPQIKGLTIAALGPKGFAKHPLREDTPLPRLGVIASPALWEGPRLVCAPLLEQNADWHATIRSEGSSADEQKAR